MKALLNKRRIAAWVAVPALAVSTVIAVGAFTAPVEAHQGNIVVTSATCVDVDTVQVIYQVSWNSVPVAAQNTVIGSRTGTTAFNDAWDDSPAAASAWANVNRGAVGSAAGSRTWTVTLEKSQFGGTNSANGPWEYAHFPWTNGNTGSRYHDTRVENFDWSKCKTTVTPASFTTTPATCTSNGSVSIPAQPAGVIVKVNGNTVTPPWSTSTPGSYTVAYTAASGYVLSNNPSGTAVVQAQLGIEQCTNPAVTGSVNCSGFVVNMSNVGGQVPVSFTVTRPDGTTEVVNVPAGGSASRTYPVVEDATATVSVTAPGLNKFTLSYTADCVPNDYCPDLPGTQPPGTDCTPEVSKPRASVNATCVTENIGEGVARLKNKGTVVEKFRIIRSGSDVYVKLQPGAKKTVNLFGLAVGSVVKVKSGGEVLDSDKVEMRPVCQPAPPPHTGAKESTASA